MPDRQPDPRNANLAAAQRFPGADLSMSPSRVSYRAGLAVFLLTGLLLLPLSRSNYLLVHLLLELPSIVLLTAVFLIGWHTRRLVSNQFFVILACGLLVAGAADLLHTLTYEGMQLLPFAGADTAAQLWLVARTLSTGALLCAIFSLGRNELCSAQVWLCSFLLGGVILAAMIWPLEIFPTCFIEGQGLTPFKVSYEYALIGLLCLAGLQLKFHSSYLNRHLVLLLLWAIAASILSELMVTLSASVYDFVNYLGHYFKLGSVVLFYLVLVEGTLRSPVATIRAAEQSCEELKQELQRRMAAEKQRQIAHREVALLYRMSRAMHSTLNLDELAHLTLSAATGDDAGRFERAMLFTVNKRTGMLQGMLGVSREMASLVLSGDENHLAWEHLHLDEQTREAQRLAPLNQLVVKQRLLLDRNDNALARAFLDKQVVLVARPASEPQGGRQLAEALEMSSYACAPLVGRDQIMGVLLVDNPLSGQEIRESRKRFLELFAGQAGTALENAGLVKSLEMAHDNLRDIQEQLIQGEKMAVLGEMAAQVAHELRNPLVSIGGFAQRLARQELQDAKANEYAGIIAREVRRMEEMLSNILAFSKKQLVCLDLCNVSGILQEVFDLEIDHLHRQKIKLVRNLAEDLPDIVGDCRQLRQVFLNLTINARQVMADGGVLTVRSRFGALRGDLAVVVEVEDTGGGISPEIMRNIFNPFFSTFAKGTGLGLSISHRIIAHHHGGIEVINAEKGARFIVTLPLEQPGVNRIDSAGGEPVD